MDGQTQFQCTGDCLKCSQGQRLYCASQHSYMVMRMLSTMQEKFDQLSAKIEALQPNEDNIFNPLAEQKDDPVTENAQDGDGAEQ